MFSFQGMDKREIVVALAGLYKRQVYAAAAVIVGVALLLKSALTGVGCGIVWSLLVAGSVICSLLLGNTESLSAAMVDSAAEAMELLLKLAGILALWSGIMKIAQESGLTALFARLFAPLLRLLFPRLDRDSEAFGLITMNITANLLKYHISDNTVGFMGNGGIIQMDRISSDVSISGLVVKEDYLRRAMGGRLPGALNGRLHNFYLQVSKQECELADRMIRTLRILVDDPHFNREASASLIAAIVNYIVGLFERYDTDVPTAQTRQQDIFNRFIALVNEHCFDHHTLDFYADRLCITQRYLGTLVRQASGTTAKEWIDRAIMAQARVLLRHSDMSILQVSDELRFPNPAFFCRFFRSHEGCSPQEYRKTM